MIEYVLMSLWVSACGGLALAATRRSPARLRMWICIALALGVALPWWQWISWPQAVQTTLPILPSAPDASGFAPQVLVPVVVEPIVRFWHIVGLLVGIGMAAFLVSLYRSVHLLHRNRHRGVRDDDLLNHSAIQAPRDVAVWRLPDAHDAWVTGVWRREIFLGQPLLEQGDTKALVTHEVAHLLARDVELTWFLTLVRCVFWWHPLVWLWVWLARSELEYACDARCATAMGDDRYQLRLAELMRVQLKPMSAMPSIGFRTIRKRLNRIGKNTSVSVRSSAGLLACIGLIVSPTLLPATETQVVTSEVTVERDRNWRVEFEQVGLSAVWSLVSDHSKRELLVHADWHTDSELIDFQTDVNSWQELVNQITLQLGIGWAEDGAGRLLIAPSELLGDKAWHADAVALKRFDDTPPQREEDASVLVSLDLTVTDDQNSEWDHEMGIQVSVGRAAAIQTGDLLVSLKVDETAGEQYRFAAALFRIEDGRQNLIGVLDDTLSLEERSFGRWRSDNREYELSLQHAETH